MTEKERTEKVKKLVAEAKKSPAKGRMYEYERFKSQLRDLDLSPEQYQYACIDISRALKV